MPSISAEKARSCSASGRRFPQRESWLNPGGSHLQDTVCYKGAMSFRSKITSVVSMGSLGAALCLAAASATVNVNDADGKSVGTAKITQSGAGVKIAYNLKGLTPGDHAMHIHQNAVCEGPKFTTAGGHFNPAGKKHGLKNPDGHHNGDMNNFTVKPDGTAKGTVMDPDVTLADGANSVFANGGTALVIHAKADDMMTDPAGNAGDRIACGKITK
jgi:Cu-Zn family superoxide dismutase